YWPLDKAMFLAANVELFEQVQPGARIALLFHVEQNLIESQLVNLQELVDQITDLGYPYEVVTEDDLGSDLARYMPVLIMANTDLTQGQVRKLNDYLEADGKLLLIGETSLLRPQLAARLVA
ncbi:hypothetical protein ACFL6S_31955, partial [Candidatus Poribacteria bacterium]